MIHVFYAGTKKPIPIGKLAFHDRKIHFEYTADFLNTGIELSPLKLPLKPGIHISEATPFEGLFGVFNDSIPDGWGRLLLDRKFHNLTPLDRLSHVGRHGMGALLYEPSESEEIPDEFPNLDQISDECASFLEEENLQWVEDLLIRNGSSAGARPKIVMRFNDEEWLVKFRSSTDPRDMGPIEYAYHLMAQQAGLEVAAAKVFASKKGPGYFGVERFDRTTRGRVHVHTIAGLLHVDHRAFSLDYETLIRATLWLTRDAYEAQKQFRRAVFNVLAHNRDDHAKNFAFTMNETGIWKVSPAYDLTFSSGPSGEHCTTIMGEGKHPTKSHLMKLASIAGIAEPTAKSIIDEVNSAVSKWKYFAQQSDVSKTSSKQIENALAQIKL